MATEEMKTNTILDSLFTQLAEPFDPSEIKWRVTHTNRDGNRGAVIAYADPRAYTDRLNQLFTPTGWTRSYQVSTVSSVSLIHGRPPTGSTNSFLLRAGPVATRSRLFHP